jgi:hypothetical protein
MFVSNATVMGTAAAGAAASTADATTAEAISLMEPPEPESEPEYRAEISLDAPPLRASTVSGQQSTIRAGRWGEFPGGWGCEAAE